MKGGNVASRPLKGLNYYVVISNFDNVRLSVEKAVVPEPLTILGAGTAIAFGAGFKRKLGKANKK